MRSQKPGLLFGIGTILYLGIHMRIPLTDQHVSDGRMSGQRKHGLMMIMWILLLLPVMKLWDLLNFMVTFIYSLHVLSGKPRLSAAMIFLYLRKFLTALGRSQRIQSNRSICLTAEALFYSCLNLKIFICSMVFQSQILDFRYNQHWTI